MAELPVLYDQFNRPIVREVLTRSIAGPSLTGIRSPIGGYPGNGLNPLRLASLLREADAGEPLRYFELAEQIEERNPHYLGVLSTRKRSVAQLEISVIAAADTPEAKQHAATVESWLDRDELQAELFDILDATGKGISFTEIIWDSSEGQWRPDRLEWRDPRWFRFDHSDGVTPLLRGDYTGLPRLNGIGPNSGTVFGGVPLAPFKFITAVIRAKSGLPVRSGLARLAMWNWMFKAFTERDWSIFVQTYGQPVRVGKYAAGASEADKDTLFNAVANIAGDCAAIIPASMLIEFITADNVGAGADVYLKRADWLDQQMSKAVLGQTATTDAIAGGHAVGQEHRQVQEDIERADAKALAAILNRDLVRPGIQLEYGPQPHYPRLRIGRPEDRNVKQIIDGVVVGVPLGMRVETSYLNDLLGVPEPAEGTTDLLTAPAPAPLAQTDPFLPFGAPGAVSRTLQAAQPARRTADVIALLADQAEQLAAPAADALINQVRAAIDRSASLQQVQDELNKLRPGAAEKNLAGVLRMVLVMANLAGRNEIAEQAQRSLRADA